MYLSGMPLPSHNRVRAAKSGSRASKPSPRLSLLLQARLASKKTTKQAEGRQTLASKQQHTFIFNPSENPSGCIQACYVTVATQQPFNEISLRGEKNKNNNTILEDSLFNGSD